MLALPRFVQGMDELDALLWRVKVIPCAFCGAHDTLIGHGFLRGYAEHSSLEIIRGRRFLCSNRGKRRGCGRTIAVLLSLYVPKRSATTSTLWAFFSRLSEGLSAPCAAKLSQLSLCVRSAYRIACSLRRASFGFRTWLATRGPPPDSVGATPIAQLRSHLLAILGVAPFPQLQLLRQCSVLS